MVERHVLLGIDQGTTRTKAILFNSLGEPISSGYREVPQIYPRPGWVEQDPSVIWSATIEAVKEALGNAKIPVEKISAIGIADQGETVVIWDRTTGQPIYNAIIWQCRRTAETCEELKKKGLEKKISEKTGLVLDAYFSATKVKWILDNISNARQKAERGEILFGTTDTWLIWNLTKGRSFVTDRATASRTMMFNIHTLEWDREILNWLDIPENILPSPCQNSEVVGYTNPEIFFGKQIPIAGVIVDQQGALFGQTCYRAGDIKNTYGTGCFVLMNTGNKPISSRHGLLTTIAWSLNGKVEYALDGGIYVTGAAVKWLKEGLQIIGDVAETEEIAKSIQDTGGVYFVPAFTGLAAPYWDMYARGTILGITGGTTRHHIVRATLESIAYQVYDVLQCMKRDSELPIESIRADGGATANRFLMQFQADVLGIPVLVSKVIETTALGAAYLAGLAVGVWKDREELKKMDKIKYVYAPRMSEEKRNQLLAGWRKAVQRALNWKTGLGGSSSTSS